MLLTLSILYGLQLLRVRMGDGSGSPRQAANRLMDLIEAWIDRLARLLRLDRRAA